MFPNQKYKILLDAMWKIAVDHHEDNPDRHINPETPANIAAEALQKIGAMKPDV